MLDQMMKMLEGQQIGPYPTTSLNIQGWVEERNPTQLFKSVGFHYRSAQPTIYCLETQYLRLCLKTIFR